MDRRVFRRWICCAAIVATSTSCAAPGTTYYGFTVGVTNAPPPPRIVRVEPTLMLVPGTSVYVATNYEYDMFRYSGRYYLLYDGYWYRSSSYAGTFVSVDVRSVPRQIVEVPARHWKHHPHGGPPGQTKKRGGPAT